MNKQEIVEMALQNERALYCALSRPKRIKHPKNPNARYVPTGLIRVTINDEWYDCVSYYDDQTGVEYARRPEEFHNFTPV